MKDKRFLVFGYDNCYTYGWGGSHVAYFDTFEDAYDYASKSKYEHLSFYDREEAAWI